MKAVVFSTILVGSLSSTGFAMGADELHRHTSPGAFLHVQYTSKAEFVQGLRQHPRALNALARHFHVSQSSVLDYIHTSLHLGRLSTSTRFEVWGLSRNGKIFATYHRFRKGTPVWETSDGTAVLRWVCSNPLIRKLPAMEVGSTPPPAPAPVPPAPTPPAPTPAQPEPAQPPAPPQPEPTPPPIPTPQPEPVPTPPTPEPAPAPTPTPAPAPEPQAPVAPASRLAPFSLDIGLTSWRLADIDCLALYTTVGAKYDPIRLGDRTVFGAYADVAGLLNNHPSFYYYGGGLEIRSYMLSKERKQGFNPYIELGYGVYRDQVVAQFFDEGTFLAPKATVGVEINSRLFLEANMVFLGKHFKRDTSRLAIDIGYRF